MTKEQTEALSPPFRYNDLNDKTYAANTKFELAALASIAVSYFDLACGSSLLGLRFEGLNERLVEAAFFMISSGLGLNYYLRFRDEGKALSLVEKNLSEIKNRVNEAIREIQKSLKVEEVIQSAEREILSLDGLLEAMSDLGEPNLDTRIEMLNIHLKSHVEEGLRAERLMNLTAEEDPSGLAASDASVYKSNSTMELVSAKNELDGFKSSIQEFRAQIRNLDSWTKKTYAQIDAVKNINLLPGEVEKLLEPINLKLNEFSPDIIGKEVRPKFAKFRIVFFSMLWPAALFVFVCAAFLWALIYQPHEPCEINQSLACIGAQI